MTLEILFEMVPKEFFNRIVRIADGDRDGVRRAADDTLPSVRRIAMKFRNSALCEYSHKADYVDQLIMWI